MAAPKAGGSPGDGAARIIDAANGLAGNVGPGWALAFVVAILLLLPRYGLLAHLAQLLKEDRADSRKRKVESERLAQKFNKRPSAGKSALPPSAGQAKLPTPRKGKEVQK